MVESIHYSLIGVEDLDLGSGTRQVRLADGALHTLTQLNLGSFLLGVTRRLLPQAGAAVATATTMAKAGMRVAGVTSTILTTFGTSQSLAGISVGDAVVQDRWGTYSTLTSGTKREQGNFLDPTWPVYASDTDILVSATGGLFDGTGEIELTLWYFYLTHRSI